MVFSLFSKQTKASSVHIVLDIGSASVAAALVELSPRKTPRILRVRREAIPFHAELSSQKLTRGVLHALERVLHRMPHAYEGRGVSSLTLWLSTPWCAALPRHLEQAFPEETTITEALQSTLVREGSAHFQESLKDQLPAHDILILEEKILNFKLNGYDVAEPFGKKAHHVALNIVSTISSKKLITQMNERISRQFPGVPVHEGAFSVSAVSALRDMVPGAHDFLMIDMTGEATECVLVNNDVYTLGQVVHRGKHALLRTISGSFAVGEGEANTLLNMYFHDTLEETRRSRMESVVRHFQEEWAEKCKKVFTRFAREGVLSRTVFLSCDADMAATLTEPLKRLGNELVGGEFDIIVLDNKRLTPFVEYAPGVIRDPFIALESLLLGKINA